MLTTSTTSTAASAAVGISSATSGTAPPYSLGGMHTTSSTSSTTSTAASAAVGSSSAISGTAPPYSLGGMHTTSSTSANHKTAGVGDRTFAHKAPESGAAAISRAAASAAPAAAAAAAPATAGTALPGGFNARAEELRQSYYSANFAPRHIQVENVPHYYFSSRRIQVVNVPYYYSNEGRICHVIPDHSMPTNVRSRTQVQGSQAIFDGRGLNEDQLVYTIRQCLYDALLDSNGTFRYPDLCALRFENCSDDGYEFALRWLFDNWERCGPYIRKFEVVVSDVYPTQAALTMLNAISSGKLKRWSFEFIIRDANRCGTLTNQASQVRT